MRVYLTLLLMFVLFTITTYAQSAPRTVDTTAPSPKAAVSATTPTPEPERVVNKDLKTQIFEVKHRDPDALARVLRGLSSFEKGTQINSDRSFKTITVRDYPENVTVIERALTRLDVPEKLPANLEFQLHIITASRAGKNTEQMPKNLAPVVTELQKTLQYSNYNYVTTVFNRAQDGKEIEAQGSIELNPTLTTSKTFYNYKLTDIQLGTDEANNEMVQVRRMAFGMRTPVPIKARDGSNATDVNYVEASILTGLSLREGEQVVVGTANIGNSDDAVILVVSVKKVK
ncbi:MAG: hypothetical protein IPK14_08560 [Blastocatellia bacterium]|nr:hypothetical protein [Blastocatellia bacterium]